MADTDFHVVELIRAATSKREIAGIVLRVPDAILLSRADAIQAECRRRRFVQAAQFIDLRLAAMDATRDRAGRLPDRAAMPLESWRVGFAAFAQSSPS